MVALPSNQLPPQQPDELFPRLSSFLTAAEVQTITSSPVAYIAAEFSDSLFPFNGQYVIGDSLQPNDRQSLYSNVALDPQKTYTFFVRAYFANVSQSIAESSSPALKCLYREPQDNTPILFQVVTATLLALQVKHIIIVTTSMPTHDLLSLFRITNTNTDPVSISWCCRYHSVDLGASNRSNLYCCIHHVS